MLGIRPVPVVLSVLATEILLAPIGAEITYQAARHEASYDGVTGLILRSFGAPWSAPWHSAMWQFNGTSTTVGLLAYLILLGLGVLVLAAGVRGRWAFATMFVGIWASSTLSLSLSQAFRLLFAGGDEVRIAGSDRQVYYALASGTASVYHAVYFGWIAALIGAVAAVHTRTAGPDQPPYPPPHGVPLPQGYPSIPGFLPAPGYPPASGYPPPAQGHPPPSGYPAPPGYPPSSTPPDSR
jgi:hypothetical protein